MSTIEMVNLSKSFGEKKVFENYMFTLKQGETVCLMGPSGCGKTTLIHILAGLEKYDAGEIRGAEDFVKGPVFQEDRLCENYSAVSNIRLVTGGKVKQAEIYQALEELGVPAEQMRTPVRAFSGGMRRRVSIARAVLYLETFPKEQALLLLDEPFQGLDRDTKGKVIKFLRSRTRGMTLICVTHDSEDAELLDGRCEQIPMVGKTPEQRE